MATDPRAALAEALGEVIMARMSRDLAWTQDDGKTVIRLDPEQAGWHLGHLVHGPLAERGVLLVPADVVQAVADYSWGLHLAGTPNEQEAIGLIERLRAALSEGERPG